MDAGVDATGPGVTPTGSGVGAATGALVSERTGDSVSGEAVVGAGRGASTGGAVVAGVGSVGEPFERRGKAL